MSSNLTGGQLRYVVHATRPPESKCYFGLDLGQRKDHSALAAAELVWTPQGRCPVTFESLFEPRLHIRHLRRFPKGLDYESLYRLLDSAIGAHAPAWHGVRRELIMDASGPGAPVVDRLRRNLDRSLILKPVLITGGKIAKRLNNGYASVPRRALISNILLVLAAQTMKCTTEIDGYDTLKAELLELGGETTQPVSSRAHDDLAIAVGLAAWAAVHDAPELLPESESSKKRSTRQSLYGPGPLF